MRVLRYSARTLLVVLALFWFSFAVLSGAESHGGGIKGMLLNLPNALPWLGLFVVVFIAFKWERIGGTLVILAGVVSVVFFWAWTSPIVLFGI